MEGTRGRESRSKADRQKLQSPFRYSLCSLQNLGLLKLQDECCPTQLAGSCPTREQARMMPYLYDKIEDSQKHTWRAWWSITRLASHLVGLRASPTPQPPQVVMCWVRKRDDGVSKNRPLSFTKRSRWPFHDTLFTQEPRDRNVAIVEGLGVVLQLCPQQAGVLHGSHRPDDGSYLKV